MTEEEIIDDILDEFDFGTVQRVMEHLNWTWHDSDGVPTLGQLRKKARYLMKCCIGLDEYTTSTGGFYVRKETYNDKPYYSLHFVLTEWNNYE